MGLLERLKQNREEAKADRSIKRARDVARREKLKDVYATEYDKGAVIAVKARARREAKEQYGKKRSVLADVGKGLEQFGNWAVGAPPKSTGKHKKGKKTKKTARATQDSNIFPDMDFNMNDIF